MMVAPDKIGHFKAGLLIGSISSLFCIAASINIWLALLPVLIAAFGKEIYDYMHPDAHKAELMDAISTITGGVIPIITMTLL